MKTPSYSQRRWRPIRWWEIASYTDPSRMPFLLHFPEPPAVLVTRLLAQARGLIAHDEMPPVAAIPVVADLWEDGGLADAWFVCGDQGKSTQPSMQVEQADHQGGSHA